MKPYKNFLFFLSILLILAAIMLVYGGKTYPLGEWSFNIPSLEKSAAIEETRVEPKVYVMSEEEKAEFLAIDSSVLAFPELQDLAYYPFDYERVEEHPLTAFFEQLSTMTDSTELLRILHYGDSQIEGDRITSAIRHYLQRSFGGCGMGAVPLLSPVNVSSYVVEKSTNWERKTVTDEVPTNALGAWMGYLQNESGESASINLRISPYILYPDASYFSNVNILVPRTQNPDSISVSDRSKTSYRFGKQNIGDHFSMISIPFDTTQRHCEIIFENTEDARVYGVSLDSKFGLTVDNLPIRGSAGYIFTRQKASLLKESFSFLNTGLILFQFGVNAVNNNPKVPVNSRALENALARELTFVRALIPDVPLIVIGVSDRAYKNGEIYETNPNVLLVREAQKNAALRTGCVFWDLFEAMGGENSIVNWVNQKPALAGKDYTHFSAKGAQKVGEMFYKSLMVEYLNYLKRQKEYALEQKLLTLNDFE